MNWGISKSTLLSIIHRQGKLHLETALHISKTLHMDLSVLLGGRMNFERMEVLHGFLVIFGWYAGLSAEDQAIVSEAFARILEVLQG